MKRATALFLGAVALALAAGYLLRDTPGYVVRTADGSYEGDITHYVYWTRLVTLGGIQAAYSGEWPTTYAVYPPVTLYPYALVGAAYRAWQDPTFGVSRAQDSDWLHHAIKLVALIWHLLAGTAIFALLRRSVAPVMAGAAAASYVANPAALYDVAHWAQPDGAHSLFSVLAVGLLDLGFVAWAWAALALAALAKPQAWVLLLLLGQATLQASAAAPGPATWRRRLGVLAKAAGSAAAVAVVVALPFVVSGRLGQLLGLPGTIVSVMPIVSADAHNLWWLTLEPRGVDPIFLPDSERMFRPITYRLAAAGLVAAALALSMWLYASRRARLAEAAALSVLGWFVFTTQAHENHLFFALPLLALAWPARRSLLGVYAALSLTVLLNMLLHDEVALQWLGHRLDEPLVERLRLVNAATNITCELVWLTWAALRRPLVFSLPRHGRARREKPRLLAPGSSAGS